jgi:hypothetical protein
MWNIYDDMFLDTKSLELLEVQPRKLYALAASVRVNTAAHTED